MYKACALNKPVWLKVIQWLGVTALLTIVAIGLWAVLPGDHTSTASLKWFQFLQTVGTFLLPPLVMAWLWSEKPMEWLGLGRNTGIPGYRYTEIFVAAVVLMLVAMPGINLIADWNSKLTLPECMSGLEQWMRAQEDAAAALTERFLSGTSVGTLLVNIGLMALLPACAEELTFRGVIQGLIVNSGESRVRSHVAVWVTAILFSAIHVQFYGFVPRMLLGAMFGYMLVWTGSLWVPITMHFVNNAVTVITYWCVYRAGLSPESVDTIGVGEMAWLGWLSLALTAVGLYFIWRLSRQISNASSRIS